MFEVAENILGTRDGVPLEIVRKGTRTMKYAAVVEESITIPGDERSRTNPGHGYPEHTRHFTKLVEFKDEEELKRWIRGKAKVKSCKDTYRIIRFEDVQIETSIQVNIK
jgi:hypothetical protein